MLNQNKSYFITIIYYNINSMNFMALSKQLYKFLWNLFIIIDVYSLSPVWCLTASSWICTLYCTNEGISLCDTRKPYEEANVKCWVEYLTFLWHRLQLFICFTMNITLKASIDLLRSKIWNDVWMSEDYTKISSKGNSPSDPIC